MPQQANLSAALNAANDLSYEMKVRPNPLELVANKSLVKALAVINDQDKAAGALQVLIPSGHLLELSLLNKQLGGDYRALNTDEARQVIGPANTEIPAIPNWNGMRCVLHTSILNQDKVLLDLGIENDLIELDQGNFASLVSACEKLNIACPAPVPQSDRNQDEQDIFNSVEQFTERRIKQRLDETLELPPLPRSAQRVMNLRSRGEVEIDELVSIVESDPSLAAQIVSWASSPFYRAPGEVKSVHDAIVRVLGFDMVLNLALGLSLGRSLAFDNVGKKQLNDYWRDSILLASTCESLVMGLPADNRIERGTIYLSGLLANLGYLILAEVFPLYFQQVQRHAAVNSHLPPQASERYVLGIDSNQIAAWLMENWQMPSNFINSVRFANEWAYEGENHRECKLISCARHLLAEKKLAPGYGTNIGPDLLDRLKIDTSFAEDKLEMLVIASSEFREQGFASNIN